jgi:hypothetical protein
MSSVPVDPENLPAGDGTPTGGRQYVYFFVPAGYVYEGGVCPAGRQAVYMLAITDLETEPGRPPVRFDGSGCPCLWRDEPGFFDDRFDYVLCGAFDPGAAPPARSTAPPVPPTASAGR